MKLDLVLTTEAVGRMATEEVVGLVVIDDEGIELIVLHRSGLSQILPDRTRHYPILIPELPQWQQGLATTSGQ